MNTELVFVVAALILQGIALLFWIRLYGRVERWVWILVMCGFLIMAAHRVSEMFHVNVLPHFDCATAVLIALIALISVLQTRRWVRRRDKQQKALRSVHNKLEALQKQVESRDSLATKVAEILGDLRTQISYYENMAKKEGLPLYENGGHDETRTR